MAASAGGMPPVWLNILSRVRAEQLAVELGVSTKGTLQELLLTAVPVMEAERLIFGCVVSCC
jgi:hypothetical protein